MRSILLLSLFANALLGLFLLRPRPVASPVVASQEFFTNRVAAIAHPARSEVDAGEATAAAPPAFSWQGVESADYRQYMANLRAIGCPEEIICDLTMAEVHKTFMRRARSILGPPSAVEYWKKPAPDRLTPEQEKALSLLSTEQKALMESLLGGRFSHQALTDVLAIQADYQIATLGWLPEEKRAAARRVFEAAELREKSLAEEDPREPHWAREKRLLEERLMLLKDVLTPAELEEYRLRSSQTANFLRQELRYFELSPEEFKAAAKIWEDTSKVTDPYKQRRAQCEAMQAILGDARTAEFIKLTDVTYAGARQAIERLNLPDDTADRVWQAKQEALAAARQLRADAALPAEVREARLQTLRTTTRATLTQLLGKDGLRFALARDAVWLPNLGVWDQ